jgi:hypothetical protein
MSETHPLIAGSPETGRAIKKYIARCMLVMEHAFQQNFNKRAAFREWAEERFQKSEDPILLLHDDPVYFVARYLGIAPTNIDRSILGRASDLAHQKNW